MRISYGTLSLLSAHGDDAASEVKEDFWTLVSFCTRPVEMAITFDSRQDNFFLDASFRDPGLVNL